MRHRTPRDNAGHSTWFAVVKRAATSSLGAQGRPEVLTVANIAKKPTLGPQISGHAPSLFSSKKIHPCFDATNCALGIDFVYLYASR
jgi:hypothetical protein